MTGLRFAFLTTFYPPFNFGGDGIGIQRFARGLARAGHRVTVIHDADGYNLLKRGPAPAPAPEIEGVEVVTLTSGFPSLSVLLTHQLGRPVFNGRRIQRLLDDGKFDVINFHNTSLVGGPGLFKYGDAVKLYMAHEHWLVCPTHVLWRYGREVCTGRQCIRCQLSYDRPPQLWRHTGFLERESRHIDAFIAMSEFSRAKHREFGFPFDMEVVPYPLEGAAAGAGGPAEPPQQRPYFLFVGRLEKIKGLDDVIPLFNGPGDADLVIAGDGDYAAELKAKAAGSDRVKFLGWVKPEDLKRYYQHARALIVPSVCFETFGIILIEAFRQGVPVLARRIGPFPEIVERGGGFLFETEPELAQAMRRLVEEPGLRERTADAARRSFSQHWLEQVVIERYLEVVKKAARKRGRDNVVARLEAPRLPGTGSALRGTTV